MNSAADAIQIETEVLPFDEALDEATRLILDGQLVAVPTETVYGLAGDATNGEAVARIFEAKGRPRFNPLIVHVSDLEMADRIAVVDDYVRHLAHAFWPGPLTLVLPLRPGAAIHPLVTAGLDTVAIRIPRGFARDLVQATGRPLAAPSANPSGRLSPTTAQAVLEGLDGRIPLVVDGGPARVGLESTIIKVEPTRAVLLRPGGLPVEEIEAATGGGKVERPDSGRIEAPGMLASHYAPRAAVRLDARHVEPGEALLAFGPDRIADAERAVQVLNLSERGHLREAATNLFAHLAALDASGAMTIAVEPIAGAGLGEAIRDRLRRAAAPRDTAGEAG